MVKPISAVPARRELQIREGARYACAGDGLCCSDVHALGPVTRSEALRVREIDPGALVDHPRLALPVLKTRDDHTCVFWDRAGGCRIHRERGAAFKPDACRQFPFGLVRTPEGLRVTTAHRCPCRTMGPRPPIDPAEARAALTIGGRLRVDLAVGDRVRLSRRRQVSFATYRGIEQRAIERLFAAGARALAPPEAALPELLDAHVVYVAHAYRAMVDGSTTGEALGWFGDALLAMIGERRIGARPRPWAWSFDRAERRIDRTRERARWDLYADFAADALFAMRWTDEGSLASVLCALAMVLRAADVITTALVRTGVGEERAAAESLVVAEVGLAGPLAYARFTDDAERAALEHMGIPPLSRVTSRRAATPRNARRSSA